MYEIASKVELNVFDAKVPPTRVGEFAVKYFTPAVVVAPEFVAPFIADRTYKKGIYKIIAAIDFPFGNKFAMQKVRDMGRDVLAAEGFDIQLSMDRTTAEMYNEVKSVTDFLKSLNQAAEIRWTLPHNAPISKISDFLGALKRVPQVTWVRLGHTLVEKGVGLGNYNGLIQMVRQAVPLPIKIGGNVDAQTFDALSKDKGIRFDMTLEQINALIRVKTPKEPDVKLPELPSVKPSVVPNAPETSEIDGETITGALGQDV
jgi:hypothetical protein